MIKAAFRVISLLCILALFFVVPVSASNNLSIPKRSEISSEVNVLKLDVPPESFNPIAATAEQLKKYGFPERPTDDNQLKNWTVAMKNAKHYVVPHITFSKQLHSTGYSTTWSGHVVQASDNHINGLSPTFYSVQSSWDQPNYTGTSADPSVWVGMDGWTNTVVLQAGTDSNATLDNSSLPRNCFWWEDYPGYPQYVDNVSINGGDQVYVSCEYLGNKTAEAFFENVTSGDYTSQTFSAYSYYGTSADFIYEAVNGLYSNWGYTTMTQCYAGYKLNGTSSAKGLSDYSSTQIVMTDTGNSSGTVWGVAGLVMVNNSFRITS